MNCYNCRYLNKNDYEYSEAGSKYLPYKKYKCLKRTSGVNVYLDIKDGSNLNKQDSESTQLKNQGCSYFGEKQDDQINIFEILGSD